MEKDIVVLIVIIATTAIAYIIQYSSILSPGYIEFDKHSKKEMKIMNKYNCVMDMAYKLYLAGMFIMMSIGLLSESMTFIIASLLYDLAYIVVATVSMTIIYIRSRIYWIIKEDERNNYYGFFRSRWNGHNSFSNYRISNYDCKYCTKK